jgi:hypothetical protein
VTLGTKAGRQTIYVKQGSDWSASFQIKDANGSTVALAGSAFQGHIRKSKQATTLAATFSFDIAGNTVTYLLPRAISSAMLAGESESDPESKYVYDIEWTKPDGTVDRIQEGVLILSREVTR